MAFVADLKYRQHRRPYFWSWENHRRIMALTSLLAGSVLHVPFWLSLIEQRRCYQSRSQWFVPSCTHSVSQSHLLAIRVLAFYQVSHMFFCSLQSLVPLWKVFASPSFPDHVSICLSHFEWLSQVMVSFTECMNGALAFSRPSNKWFGVSAVKSSGPSLIAVRGLALRVCYTRRIVVLSTSLVKLRLSKIAIIVFSQFWTSLYKIPPNCGPPGGLNLQTIFFWAKSLSILALSHSFMIAF